MGSVLDILLAGTARNVQKEPEEKLVEIPRLSQLAGAPVHFRLRGLRFNEIAELSRDPHMDAKAVLAGVVEPDFGSIPLARHYGVLAEDEDWDSGSKMRVDLVKAMLQPGEISELSREIQKLSGYLKVTVKTVKKN